MTELEDEMFEVRRESFPHIDEALIHLAANALDGSVGAITRELMAKGLRRDDGILNDLYEIRKVAEQRVVAVSGTNSTPPNSDEGALPALQRVSGSLAFPADHSASATTAKRDADGRIRIRWNPVAVGRPMTVSPAMASGSTVKGPRRPPPRALSPWYGTLHLR